MTRIRLLPEAQEELRAAARFYESLQPGLGWLCFRRYGVQSSVLPNDRRHRVLSVATFGSKAFFASLIVSTIGAVLTRLSSLRLVIVAEGLDSGATARSHITNLWSARVQGEVPCSNRCARGAQLNR